ncbi:MAG: ATP-binding protein involved in chromosome partitioning, partial [Crocinitomicaceae bacterium]
MTEITKEEILKILNNVIEPDLKKSIVELGLVTDVQIEGNAISFIVKISSPTMNSKKIVKDACMDSLLQTLGTDIKL